MVRLRFQVEKRVVLCVLATLSVAAVFAQSCPPANSTELEAKAPSSLHGTIRYHEGTRPWLGLVPDHPACGATEIELAFGNSAAFRQAKRMRNCKAAVRGTISDSVTVYYSTDLNFFDPRINPDPGCHLFPQDPDYTTASIPNWVIDYRATVFIDVPANKPLKGEVMSGGSVQQPLTPWQAYAQVSLNGEKDLDLGCRAGFKLISFRGSAADQTQLFIPGLARITSSVLGPAWLSIECRRK